MLIPKTNYELSRSQVRTPPEVVTFFWDVLKKHRGELGRVVDFGAADACFAQDGYFQNYLGIEIDPQAAKPETISAKAEVRIGCAFAMSEASFDACIGNPPYVRHHDIESPWKENTLRTLGKDLDIRLDGHGNLFLYFIALGLIKTCADGLVAMVVPFEWVSRPSANGIRSVIDRERWAVTVYRFVSPIFDGVLTTASISVIDKAKKDGSWSFFDINDKREILPTKGPVKSGDCPLGYAPRGRVYSRRGLSPGTQAVFTLTESERLRHGLYLSDVVPCVTSLREVPKTLRTLNKKAFRKHFIDAGRRCWLIKSNREKIGPRLTKYVASVPKAARETYTCQNQDPWYSYEGACVPDALIGSGFVERTPKMLINSVGAVNVGAVYGIYVPAAVSIRSLQIYLQDYDFESRVVPHAKSLRKIEVRQLNTVLEEWWQENSKR